MTNTPHSGAAHGLSTLFHTDALPLGTMLGEFEVTGLLGVGGFGMVYDAFDHSLQRMVAIKEYMPSALAGRSEGPNLTCRSSGDKEALNAGLVSFIAEARLLAQFDHPSLVKVYRFWEANNTAYMVMPLYKGMTLKHARTQAQSPPPEAWLRPMLWSVLGGLKYLHAHNVVHRDISPDNIFLQEVGPPVLLDLGAARRAIGESSQKHTAILKVNYAPIEQYADASDLPQGPWTDLYALAAVVHGSLCNAQPLPATFRVVRDRLPPFASVAKTVESIFGQEYSAPFVRAFGHALEIQPQDRPQSVQAFIDEMGLTAPTGPQTMSWRSLPAVGNAPPVVDSEAKTVYQAPSKAVTTIDAPVTDDAPLELVSAYGVLDQESPLLVPHPEPELPSAEGKPPLDAETGLDVGKSAAKSFDPPDGFDPPGKAKSTRTRRASAKAVPVAAAPAAVSKVKFAVIATVSAVALLAATLLWSAKSKPTAPQIAQPPAVAPIQATPVGPVATVPAEVVASPANAPTQKSAADSTRAPAPTAVASSAPGTGAPPKPQVTVKAGVTGTAGMAGVAKSKPDTRSPLPKAPASASAKAAVDTSGGAHTTAPVGAPDTHSTPAASAHAAAAPALPRASAAKDRPGPTEICADKNFLVRPMCIHQECEKPEFAQSGFCVENARRLKDSAKPADRQ